MAGNWQADFERGVQLMQAQEYAEAREVLERAHAAAPAQALLAYSLAVTCAQTGDKARAEELLGGLERSGELTPAGRELLDNLRGKGPAPAAAPAPAPAAPATPTMNQGGGLKLDFGALSASSPAAAPASGGLQLNFGAPAGAGASGASQGGGLKLNFGAPAGAAQGASQGGGLKLNFNAPTRVLMPPLPNRFGPGTVLRMANSGKTWKDILRFHGELGGEPELDKMYRECHAAYGECWHYADAFTITYAAVKCAGAKNYLDLGTGRGRNLLAAIRAAAGVNFIACDDWDDAGLAVARDFAASLKGTGTGKFLQGRPAAMLPKMMQVEQGLRFDVVTIAGSACQDAEAVLRLALPLLRGGGVAVLGELNRLPGLSQIWHNTLGAISGFAALDFCEAGAGVGIAVKVG